MESNAARWNRVGQEHMVPQQEGNRMLAHGIVRQTRKLRGIAWGKQWAQAPRPTFQGLFGIASKFSCWFFFFNHDCTLLKWVKVILWRPMQEKRDDKLAPTIPAEEAADLLLDKQKALEVWRNRHVFTDENALGALVVSNAAGLLGQGLQTPRSFQRKQGGTARWETLSDFNIL